MSVLALLLALAVPGSAAHTRRAEPLVTPEAAAAASAAGTAAQAIDVMAEEALVVLDENFPPDSLKASFKAAGMEYVSRVGSTRWHLIYLPEGMPTSTGLTLAHAQPGVVWAQPNRAYRPERFPSDPQVASQYHLSNINAFAAWEYDIGSTNDTVIAVMDTGIQGDHPDLQSKFIAGASRDCSAGGPCQTTCQSGSCAGQAEPRIACNHGTRVAGAAAAVTDNGTGVAGISWGARLVSLKVFPRVGCNDDCSHVGPGNTCVASDASIIAAINYARLNLLAANRRVIMNMSVGATGPCPSNLLAPPNDAAVQQEIDTAYGAANGGVLFVASAGNSGGEVNNPASCLNVIPVGATDSSNGIASFSSRDVTGTSMSDRGVVAPGVGIFTTDINGGYTGGATGTSFSSPIVAGLAALIASARPALTNDQVRATLRGSTSKIGVASVQAQGVTPQGAVAGAGMVNAYSAMRLTVTGSTEFDGTQKAIAFPNPFKVAAHGTVTITVPRALEGANTSIKVYTPAGQLVKTLKGLTWDGKNESGNSVASGTYVFLVSTEKGQSSGRVAVIR